MADDADWLMLDDEQWRLWSEMHLLEGKTQVLRWDERPSDPAAVTELRLLAADASRDVLPAALADLPALRSLEFDKRFLAALEPGAVPPSVTSLQLTGEGAATWPRDVPLPGVRELRTGRIALRFSPEQFPGLEYLGIRLGTSAAVLGTITAYERLDGLGVVTVNSPAFFDAVAKLGLRRLGISGGKLDSIAGLALLPELERLALSSLAKLTSLSGLAALPRLQELSLAYCKHVADVADLEALPPLRRLEVIGCNFRAGPSRPGSP